ncbi:MAG: molybdenum cofactor biosynthesis protein MoaE [Gemmatimonadaceae bacterium]
MRAAIVNAPIDTAALMAEVADGANGATSVFLGTVRSDNDGKDVTGIEYSAYEEMVESEMTAILEEARSAFAIEHAVIEHRVGTLAVGDVSIAVVVATPHRSASLGAVQYIVEEVKGRAPIWKLEHYVDGTRGWVGAGARETPR